MLSDFRPQDKFSHCVRNFPPSLPTYLPTYLLPSLLPSLLPCLPACLPPSLPPSSLHVHSTSLSLPLTYQLLDEHAMLELLVGIAIRVKAEEVDELGIEQEGVAAVQRHLRRKGLWVV